MVKIRIENIPNYICDVRVEFDGGRRGKAFLPSLRMFNALGQGLNILLKTDAPNKLFLYSLFPLGVSSPNTHSLPVYFYDNHRKPGDNLDIPHHYDEISLAEFETILTQ